MFGMMEWWLIIELKFCPKFVANHSTNLWIFWYVACLQQQSMQWQSFFAFGTCYLVGKWKWWSLFHFLICLESITFRWHSNLFSWFLNLSKVWGKWMVVNVEYAICFKSTTNKSTNLWNFERVMYVTTQNGPW